MPADGRVEIEAGEFVSNTKQLTKENQLEHQSVRKESAIQFESV